jgi:CSLREA domain-containing protein
VPVGGAGIRSCCRLPLAAVVILACVLVAPAPAAAELFTVDTVADEADASLGAAGCATAAGKCSLRAAIEESNASTGEFDEIIFDETLFDGSAASAITLGSGLPSVTDPARINGRECETASGVRGPCVEVDGTPTAPGLSLDGAAESEIEGLAITAAEVGVLATDAARVKVRSSWFGVALDGAAAGNGTGIRFEAGTDSSRIGGEGPEAGNLIANSSGDGLAVVGASGVRVLGNVFGIAPGGTTAAPNGLDLRVASTASDEALGNSIGTTVGPAATASAACDGGCNLISGSASDGIDLAGDGGTLGPAIATVVAGNQIGLGASGQGSVPNSGVGVLVGSAPQTLVGGTKAGSGNEFVGGSAALTATGAPDLVVRGNLIGTPAAAGPAPEEGIVVSSEGLATAAVEALIGGNRIGLDGGSGIVQQGFGAWIFANTISGAATGIGLEGQNEGEGNLVEGNSVDGTTGVGILIANDANRVVGNRVSGAGAAGVEIDGPPPFGVTENQIGGDTAGEENTVNGSAGAAIAIVNAEGTQNEVARNRGAANLGPFIDLRATSPATEPAGPNGGILPPALSVSTGGAAGSAEPGAIVRVFGKQTPLPGEISSFLGSTVADGEGAWSLSVALVPGTVIAATQTNLLGGTSELAIATVPETAGGGGGGQPPAGGSRDTRAPQTRITGHPRPRSQRRSARFRFASDEKGSKFICSLDGRPYRPCRSPKTYSHLKPGVHVFRVRAIDAAGNTDPQPARWRFIVLG